MLRFKQCVICTYARDTKDIIVDKPRRYLLKQMDYESWPVRDADIAERHVCRGCATISKCEVFRCVSIWRRRRQMTCFTFRNKIGLDIAIEAPKDCLRQKQGECR